MSLCGRCFQGMLVVVSLCLLQVGYAQSSWEPNDAKLAVKIEGIEGPLLKNARAYVGIKALEGQKLPSIFRVRYLARKGEQELRTAIEPYGFYNAQVTSEVIEGETTWTVLYTVEVGPVTTYGDVNIGLTGSAQYDAAFQKLLEERLPSRGQPFNHQAYENLKSGLRNLAAERGYYDAQFSAHSIRVERDKQIANMTLVFESGERYLFGETSFCCSFLNESLLERFIHHQRGEPFNTRALLDLQVDLAGSEYFSTVEVSPRWDQATTNQVPIDVTLSPNKRDRYQIGLGYGTDTGARITMGFDRRWVNDRGHRLSSVIRLSEVQNTGYVSYIIPGNDPARDSYSFNGEITDRSFEAQRSKLYRASFKDIRHYDRWHRTYQVAYQREDFSFGDEPTSSSSFLIPSVEWSLIESSSLPANRNIIDDGYRISIMLQGAHESALADTNFASVKLSAKWVHRLSDEWRVLMRGEVGALQAGNFSALGPTLRFFSGGDHNVRGYAYQQLGPTNEEGVVVGGRFMTANSIEVDYAFKSNWRVALFTDIGNSMMDWNDRLKQSVGFGIRWVSPIGPVRLDLAMAMDEPSNPWRLHLTLGPDL